MEIFNRSLYYKQISPFIGKNLIKVVTGQRRVGKSCFLRQILNEIMQKDEQTQVIFINKEDFAFDSIRNYVDLIGYVESKTTASKSIALFIDEIQEIENFEKAIRHFHSKEIFDIYCTGSNAKDHEWAGDRCTNCCFPYCSAPER